MPFRDQTGPRGEGPMTGRGRGVCAGGTAPGSLTAGPGFGMGRGGRGGRGQRNRFRGAQATASGTPTATAPAPADQQQEMAALKAAIGGLASALGEIQKRMEELEAAPQGGQ